MADALDILRNDAFQKRIHGIPGGNRILWGEKDIIQIYDHLMSVRMEEIVTPQSAPDRKAAVDDGGGRASSPTGTIGEKRCRD